MSLRESIAAVIEQDIPTAFERFGSQLDAEWIASGLEETGTASVRRRKIPAPLVSFRQACLAGILARGRLTAQQEAPCRRTHRGALTGVDSRAPGAGGANGSG
jgi:hypothetical protein